jgi:hypothetical protein
METKMAIRHALALTAAVAGFILGLTPGAQGQTAFRYNPNGYNTAPGVTQGVVLPAVVNPAANFVSNPYAARYGGYPYGGYPYGYGTTPAQGYLTGTANVYGAQGQYLVDRSQAAILDQQAKQAKVDTQRKVFDEQMYEAARTPSAEDKKEKSQFAELRRMRNDPPQGEIWSGNAINVIVAAIVHNQTVSGLRGPTIPLEEDMVKRINVTAGTTLGSISILKNLPLDWPLSLQTDAFNKPREAIDTLLPMAVDVVKQGGRKNEPLLKVFDAIRAMKTVLQNEIDNMTPDDYIRGNRFLTQVSKTVQGLQTPGVGNFFNGTWEVSGSTVDQLIASLSQKGLKFAPAADGDEAAYTVLYQSILAYDIGLGRMCSSSGR